MTRTIKDATVKRQIIRFLPVKDYPSLDLHQEINGKPTPDYIAEYLNVPTEQVARVLPTIKPEERFG